MGTPSEQIGFQASEEYTSRMSSPRPQSWAQHPAHSNTSQAHVDSPLKKESAPGDAHGKAEFEGTLSKKLERRASAGPESEIEDEDTIHVDAPGRRISKIYGGAGHLDSTEDLGPYAGNGEEDGIHDELGYGAPILASDEVAKEPFVWELQPAVSPLNESRANPYEEHNVFQRSGSASSSRTPSRPTSTHGGISGFRPPSERPLESLDEYEPLFSDGEEGEKEDASDKPATAPEKLNRPQLKVSLNKLQYRQHVNRSRTANSLAEISGKTPQIAYNTLPQCQPHSCLKRRKRTPGSSQPRRARPLSKLLPGGRKSLPRRKPKSQKAS